MSAANIFDIALEESRKSALPSWEQAKAYIKDQYTSMGSKLDGSGAAGKWVMDNAGNIARGLGGAAIAGAAYGATAGRRRYETEDEFRARRSRGILRSALAGGALGGLYRPGLDLVTKKIPSYLEKRNREIAEAEAARPTGPQIVQKNIEDARKGFVRVTTDPRSQEAMDSLAGNAGAVVGAAAGIPAGIGLMKGRVDAAFGGSTILPDDQDRIKALLDRNAEIRRSLRAAGKDFSARERWMPWKIGNPAVREAIKGMKAEMADNLKGVYDTRMTYAGKPFRAGIAHGAHGLAGGVVGGTLGHWAGKGVNHLWQRTNMPDDDLVEL